MGDLFLRGRYYLNGYLKNRKSRYELDLYESGRVQLLALTNRGTVSSPRKFFHLLKIFLLHAVI
jgi:hypothetical protein